MEDTTDGRSPLPCKRSAVKEGTATSVTTGHSPAARKGAPFMRAVLSLAVRAASCRAPALSFWGKRKGRLVRGWKDAGGSGCSLRSQRRRRDEAWADTVTAGHRPVPPGRGISGGRQRPGTALCCSARCRSDLSPRVLRHRLLELVWRAPANGDAQSRRSGPLLLASSHRILAGRGRLERRGGAQVKGAGRRGRVCILCCCLGDAGAVIGRAAGCGGLCSGSAHPSRLSCQQSDAKRVQEECPSPSVVENLVHS